jgi:diacylglycerol kinase (ATP)
MRDHVLLSSLALSAFIILQPSALWWAVAGLGLALGLGLEALNAGIEALADKLHPERHAEIGAVKDMVSAGVLVVNTAAAAIVGAAIWQCI